MPQPFVDTILAYLHAGGFVMPPLVLATLVLWYAIGYRAMTLRRGARGPVRHLVGGYRQGLARRPRGLLDRAARRGVDVARRAPGGLSRILDEALFGYYEEAKSGRTIIMGIVSIAPLIGLLGTVSGMIETFDSLGDMTLFAQSGGIAGGISQALFSTQMGLCVAVPGVIVGRLLDRRQRRIEEELDQIKALLGGTR
jgi:biopolymer transport protein ExbB